MTRGAHCHGDFCALASHLVEATQARVRQEERDEDERLQREAKITEDKSRAEDEAKPQRGAGYINFSMLAAVAVKEREKDRVASLGMKQNVSY